MSAAKSDKPNEKLPPDAAYIIPSHGHGRLMPARKGEIRNPNGLSGRYGEVVRLARQAAPEVMQALIAIALDQSEDARARIVAMQEILGRAFGRIKTEVSLGEAQPVTLDASKLTDRELAILEKLASSAVTPDE